MIRGNPRVIAITCALAALTAVSQTKPQMDSVQSDWTAIEAIERQYVNGFHARDVNPIMSIYAPGEQLYVFDAVPPRAQASWDAVKRGFETLFAAYPGPLDVKISGLEITIVGPLAY